MKENEKKGILIPTIEDIRTLLDEKLKGLTIVKEIPSEGHEEYLDMDGVRLLLGGGNGKMVSKATINNWRKLGIIVAYKIGPGRNAIVRFKKSQILLIIAAMEVGICSKQDYRHK